jgi:hypothetical protein
MSDFDYSKGRCVGQRGGEVRARNENELKR